MKRTSLPTSLLPVVAACTVRPPVPPRRDPANSSPFRRGGSDAFVVRDARIQECRMAKDDPMAMSEPSGVVSLGQAARTAYTVSTQHSGARDVIEASAKTGAAQAPSATAADAPPVADDADAHVAALFTALYDDLRRLARREARRNGAQDIVSTGTLVHDAWLDISRRPSLAFEEPGRFLAYAARTMRGLVIDRVRSRHAQKRGGGLIITSLDTHIADQLAEPEQLESIGAALDELAILEPELAHVVDLKFFCGFTLAEVATMQGVSERTAQRQWEKARLLLYSALGQD
jgi:RNA polymerase sigma factor (TIGR02999 family)